MDTAEMVVLVSGSFLILWTLWFFFGARDEKPRAAIAEAETDEPIYVCPMHAWITSRDPKADCSICGMKLVRAGILDTT